MIGAFVCFLSVMIQLCDILGVGENWVVNAHRHLCCCLQIHVLLFNLTTD